MKRSFQLMSLFVAVIAVSGVFLTSRPARAQQSVTIPVGDFWFCNSSFDGGVCQTTISVGDTVTWDFSHVANQHTTTECGATCDYPTSSPLWNSGRRSSGAFQFTFTQAGTFLYQCQVHPTEMRGRIVVQAAAASPTAPPAGQTPAGQTPTSGATPTSVAAQPGSNLPKSGYGPQSGSSDWRLLSALALVGATTFGIGLAYRRKTR